MYAQQYGSVSQGGGGGQSSFDSALLFLKQLNVEELQGLMDDNVRLNQMVDDLDLIKHQEVDKETQLASNKSIAEYNLSREPRLIESRQQLADTYEQASSMKQQYEHTKCSFDAVAPGSTSLDTTLALLQTEAAKSEEESEACADSFLSRQINTDDFLQQYIELRTLAHTRKVKVDKMTEIVRDQERVRTAQAAAANRPTPLPPYNGPAINMWAPPAAAPYPMNSGYPFANTAVYQ